MLKVLLFPAYYLPSPFSRVNWETFQ